MSLIFSGKYMFKQNKQLSEVGTLGFFYEGTIKVRVLKKSFKYTPGTGISTHCINSFPKPVPINYVPTPEKRHYKIILEIKPIKNYINTHIGDDLINFF